MPVAFSSIATRIGARNLFQGHMAPAKEDLGGKLQYLISAVNTLQSAVSALNVQVSALNRSAVSAAGSGASFSAYSTAPSALVGTMGSLSNFTA